MRASVYEGVKMKTYFLYDYHNNMVVKDIVEDELSKLDYDSDKQLVYEKPESEAEYAAFLDWLAAWHTACGQGSFEQIDSLRDQYPRFFVLHWNAVFREL